MIRAATLQDYEKVKHIKEQLGLQRENLSNPKYKEEVSKKGFLLYGDFPLEKYTEALSGIFLVAAEGERITGFIQISNVREMTEKTPVVWDKPEMKEIYFTQPDAVLYRIAVDPSCTGKGIAGKLLEEAIRKIDPSISHLFSIVVISPIRNSASIYWHEKHGFEKVALISREHHSELDNYQSIVYAKKLG